MTDQLRDELAKATKPDDVHDFGDAINPSAPHNKYRKTALIEATQWWKMGDHPAVKMSNDVTQAIKTGQAVPWIETLEGGHIVTAGDWIATGIKGEHWPIKPDIFAATYELATDAIRELKGKPL